MNLTNLRRLVLVADVAALAAAGAAGWYSFQTAPAVAKDWAKIFPVRQAQTSVLQGQEVLPKEEYTASITFAQGEKPVEVKPSDAPPPVKVDPFREKYRLHSIFKGPTMSTSFVQLADGPGSTATIFSVGLGGRIPAEPGAIKFPVPVTSWRLNELRVPEGTDPKTKQPLPCAAVFVNVETEEQQVLEMVPGNNIELENPETQKGGQMIGVPRPPGPTLGQTFQGVKVKAANAGDVAWEIGEEELEYLDVFGAEEAKKISTVESKDGEGNPDGFTLKGVPAGSRAADVGFKAEDKVISVNDEKVTSTADAMSKGKKQYEVGKTSFEIKVLRQGKEVNFMFHAPPKKRVKP
jgi:hypothetical protein